MGLGREFIQRLLDLKRSGNLDRIDSVAEIGNQQLGHRLLTSPILPEFLSAFDASDDFDIAALKTRQGDVAHGDIHHQAPDQPNSRLLWHAIGARYAGFDLDDDPDTVALDLNFDSVPEEHRGQYGLVTNLGTTEHVLNQFNAFKVMHDLCRPGGLMIHELPNSGYLTHGFFTYTPKLFWQLAKANDYVEVDGGIESDLPSGGDYRVYDIQAAYYSSRMWAPWVTRQVRGRDIGIVAVLAKRHDAPFRMPLDAADFGSGDGSDPSLVKRYPAYFAGQDVGRSGPGPAFTPIHRHAVDEEFCLSVATRLGDRCATEIRNLAFDFEGTVPRAVLVCRYLDRVREILLSAYQTSRPIPVAEGTVDLAGEDFVGVEWGIALSNRLGQRWRYLGPRDRSTVLMSLKPGIEYVVEFDILDVKPGVAEALTIACNDVHCVTEIRSADGGLTASARIEAAMVAREGDGTAIELLVRNSPNRFRPGSSLTDVPPNRASLTEMRVRPAESEI